jgi:hypothetical protein
MITPLKEQEKWRMGNAPNLATVGCEVNKKGGVSPAFPMITIRPIGEFSPSA